MANQESNQDEFTVGDIDMNAAYKNYLESQKLLIDMMKSAGRDTTEIEARTKLAVDSFLAMKKQTQQRP